jgi:DNA-binding beta-propeller fold protein YncE
VAYGIAHGISRDTPVVIPISRAGGQAGNPVRVGDGGLAIAGGQIAITPDGKTAYVVSGTHAVIPVSTVTNTAGQPIQLGPGCRSQLLATPELSIAITPDGKSVYVACEGAVIPVSTKTNTPGQPIRIAPGYPNGIAITGP